MSLKSFSTLLAALAFSTCSFAGTAAWVATGNDRFGSVDLTTGAYADIADLGFLPAGLGEIGDSLYTEIEGGTTLYKINPTNGSVSSVGKSNISAYAFGSTRSGLYMIDALGGLYNINQTSGASTYVGSTLLPIGVNTTGVSTGSDSLYFALGSSIYTINTADAHATYVGSTAPNMYGSLVDIQGAIYGASITGSNQTYSFNLANGSSSLLAETTLPDYAWGLAPEVPEPGSLALLGLAGVFFGGYALKRKRNVA